MHSLQKLEIEKARRSLLDFMKYAWVRNEPLIVGLHTDAICKRIDKAISDFRNGKSTFLIIKIPFRHGKSDISSRYLPPYFLGNNSDEEIMLTAYDSTLACDFSRFGRNLIKSEKYTDVFPSISLRKDEQATDHWGIEDYSGRVTATGVGGAATGRGYSLGICLKKGTIISTKNGDKKIEDIVIGDMVLSLDEGIKYDIIKAVKKRFVKEIYEISTGSNIIQATREHRIFVQDKGYIEAKCVQIGDKVITLKRNVCKMRKIEIRKKIILQRMLRENEKNRYSGNVQFLWKNIFQKGIRNKKGKIERTQRSILFYSMFSKTSCDKKPTNVQSMQDKTNYIKTISLLRGMQKRKIKIKNKIERNTMQRMWKDVQTENASYRILLKNMQFKFTFKKNGFIRKFKLSTWIRTKQIQKRIQTNIKNNKKRKMHSLWLKRKVMCTSQRYGQRQQSIIKSRSSLQTLPFILSPIKEERIQSIVIKKSTQDIEVYDLTVGDSHNYFANGILVHNCDDYLKNRAEAESPTIRAKQWDWFTNVFLTRRAPVAITILLATPWHTDDIIGRCKKMIDEDEKFPKFETITFPAFSKKYPTGTLFPERFSIDWYESQKASLGSYGTASLMQCDPIQRGGNFIKTDKLQFIDAKDIPEDIRWCRGWDLASTEAELIKDDPDYTAGGLVGVRWIKTPGTSRNIPHLYIGDMVRIREEAIKRNEIIKNTAHTDGSRVVVATESVGGYKDTYTIVHDALKGVCTVFKSSPSKDKIIRIDPVLPIFEAGNVFIVRGAWNEAFVEELSHFPDGEHDDQVDTISISWEILKNRGGSSAVAGARLSFERS